MEEEKRINLRELQISNDKKGKIYFLLYKIF